MNDQFHHVADREVTSTIGERERTRGDVHVGGCLRVDGIVRGNIESTSDQSSLILSPHARIEGDVSVHRARIEGHVTGTMTIEGHLDVLTGAVIEGDVRYRSMTIEAGATVNGGVSALRDDYYD